MKAKLWWVERATAPYMNAFEAGPVVVLLAIAAQLEGTGVRMFGRHLDVLEQMRADDPTTAVLREILSDEKRHAKSCAQAVDRLVRDEERGQLEELRERIAKIDRAFGVTISVGVALGRGTDQISTEGLLQEADAALYRAKTAGRNRVFS